MPKTRTIAIDLGLVLAAVLAVAAATACGGDREPLREEGSLALATKLAHGVAATQASYAITGNGRRPISGRFEIVDPAATILVIVNRIAAGVGYRVTVTAMAPDGERCEGASRLDIYPDETTGVGIVLQCHPPTGSGQVEIDATVRPCPAAIASYAAAPLTATAGDTIELSASAAGAASPPVPSFQWSATAGTFQDPRAAATTYTCATGPQTLTLVVSNGSCSDSVAIPVTCLAQP